MNKKYKILPLINSPSDLKALSKKSLNKLSLEIADYINEVVTTLGGHYSSPLGVIDLTIALHYVYKSPKDKIIWDVGHQAYSHKIITGRRDAFSKIRQLNEISGFLRRSESEHDIFGAGHSSTSLSAALGFAHYRDRLQKDDKVVAVIGDGAMTNGMVFEALNNIGYNNTQMTVILNDNSFSISESVGALSKYLTKLVTNPTYNSIRDGISKISTKIPEAMGYSRSVSTDVKKILKKAEAIKTTFTPGGLFEELGLMYVGPIDGHNIDNLINVLTQISKIDKPVLLHIHTDKSKYVRKETNDPIKYYSLSPKISTSKNVKSSTFSSVFGKSIYRLANNNNFTCITAAMKVGTGLSDFSKDFPTRYVDVGIAEEHAVTYGAGLSAAGELPVIVIYSTFMQRAYDQILHDIALQDLPAVLCMDRAGLVANDGPTHHGVFDLAFMRTIPNAVVTAPSDGNELDDLLYTALMTKKLFSIRYGKLPTNFNEDRQPKLLDIGKWKEIYSGQKIAILAVGSMVEISKTVIKKVNNDFKVNIGLFNCLFVKPLDTELLDEIFKNYELIYTIEEGNIAGGFGSAILEYNSKTTNSNNVNIKILGIEDCFVEHGSRTELLDIINMSEDKIYKKIVMDINEQK